MQRTEPTFVQKISLTCNSSSSKVLVHLGPSLVRRDPPSYAGVRRRVPCVQGRVHGTLPCTHGTLPCTPAYKGGSRAYKGGSHGPSLVRTGPSDVRRRTREGPGVQGRVPDGLGPYYYYCYMLMISFEQMLVPFFAFKKYKYCECLYCSSKLLF